MLSQANEAQIIISLKYLLSLFIPIQMFVIKCNKYLNLNKWLLMCLDSDKHLHVVNATEFLYTGVLISFPLHCEENSPSNKICAFCHIPRATAVT